MVTLIQSIFVGIKMSFIEMASHKLRSALSIIGVMLGVASLVAMLTLIAGIDVFLNEKMGRWAGAIWFRRQRDVPLKEKIAWSRSPGMRYSDGSYLEQHAPDAEMYYRQITRHGTIHVLGAEDGARLRGVSKTTLEDDMESMKLVEGRWFSNDDYTRGEKVCILSWELDERLCRQLTLSGKEKRTLIGNDCIFNNKHFTIVGIYAPADPDFKPWHMRRAVYIPVKTMQLYITGSDPDPGSLRLSVKDPEKIEAQAYTISQRLTERHRGVEDFEYRTAEWLEEIRGMLDNVSVLMGVVSVISLLVGGLSIMNVMLSSVSERIHEIGIRKALGARNLQIFVQFISETTTLSFTGGTVGVFLGMITMLFRESIKKSTEGAVEPTIVVTHILYVFGIIVGVGVIFGLYPAVKAMRMNPIEALRYE